LMSVLAKTAVVVPAFNAGENLSGVISEISSIIPRDRIIVVDDGSVDNTSNVASSLSVILLRHERNLGKGAALMTGIKAASDLKMSFIITMDADGQHNPREIMKFIDAAEQTGADIIVGDRMSDTKDMPRIRIITNKLTSWVVSKMAGQAIPDSQNGYRLLKTRIFDKISIVTNRYDTESEILIKAGRAGAMIGSVPVETIYKGEQSSIHPLVDTYRFLRMAIMSFFW